jgi:SAM-dependent methyltransferase
MSSGYSFWHARFCQQSGWTENTRRYIFNKVGISPNDHLLEVGCGGGAVLKMLEGDGYRNLHGIDHDLNIILQAKILHSPACADGLRLPFQKASFNHCLCHFYLMWVSDALTALREMARVTTPGGWVLALAEPDYGGRIDYPQPLEVLGEMQTKALRAQGADTLMGRRLLALLKECGLDKVNAGIISAQWEAGTELNSFRDDWHVLKRDLADMVTAEELDALMSRAEASTSKGDGMWYVPIFYAYGRVSPAEKD